MPTDTAPRLSAGSWIDVLEREYLDSYIREGGAAVKFAVSDDAGLRHETSQQLRRAAERRGYLVAEVRSEETKLHLAQELFFAVSAAVPWMELAEAVAVDAIANQTGHRVQPAPGTPADRMRTQYAEDGEELKIELRRGLRDLVLGDAGMARDFRYAMLTLCRDASGCFGAPGNDTEAIEAWLAGQPIRVGSISHYGIYRKITRANALIQLESLHHWARKAGRPGIVLTIDLVRLLETPPRPRGDGVYYTRPALLDAYEVLRQMIDGTDRMEGSLVVAFADSSFLETDGRARGMATYQALNYRLADEIRGSTTANPMSALVRLTP